MGYSSLSGTRKAFQLTALSMALTIVGCGGGGGGDTVDSIKPVPCLGLSCDGNAGGNGGNAGGDGGDNPVKNEADFFLQKIVSDPGTVQLGKDPKEFKVVVKAVEKATGGAVAGKKVTLSVADSQAYGVTINGDSTQTTNEQGDASFILTLNPGAVENKAKLLQDGIQITASATALDGSVKTQVLTVGVSVEGAPGSEVPSDLKIGTNLESGTVSSADAINAYGDTVTVAVSAKKPNGAAASGVTALLGIAEVDGVTIIGGNETQTDENGVATFEVAVSPNLTDAARAELIKTGINYNIKLVEEDGSVASSAGVWAVANPASDYTLAVTGNVEPLSVYGDTQTLNLTATPISGDVPTDIAGAKASIALNNMPEGVSLTQSTVTLDENGQASVNLIISDALTTAEREALAENGISYTITLTEPSKAVTIKTASSEVYIPSAQYKVLFDESSKRQLSIAGDIANISFRVNDSNGGPVVGQEVQASLSSALKDLGLVTLDNAAIQQTDERGIVTYTVRIPAGLSTAQKAKLENIEKFVLGVSVKEATGVVSTTVSQPILVSSSVGQSTINLSTDTSVSPVNVLGETFKVRVKAVQNDGAAAVNQTVKLSIANTLGVSIIGGNLLTTNENGVAEFTVNLSDALSQTNREALIATGINYLAVLTEADGTQSKAAGNIPVAVAVSDYTVNVLGNNTPVSAYGDVQSLEIVAIPNSSEVTSTIEGATTTITLNTKVDGVSLDKTSVVLDSAGKANVTLTVADDLNEAQRNKLKNSGISYTIVLNEPNNTVSTKTATSDVYIPAAQYKVLFDESSKRQLSSAGDSADITFRVNNSNGGPVAGQEVEASLSTALQNLGFVTLDTASTQVTNERGLVTYTVRVPSGLTETQRLELENLEKFVLGVSVKEDNGVVSTTVSQPLFVSSEAGQSNIQLSADTNVDSVNVLGDTFKVRVNAVQMNGAVAVDEKVQLIITNTPGVSITGGNVLTTDQNGVAEFTVNVNSALTQDKRDALIASGINYLAVLTEANGTQSTINGTVAVTKPNASINFKNIAADTIDSIGGSGAVVVTLANKDGTAIVDKEVTLALTNTAAQYGVTVNEELQNTDIEGKAVFIVNVPDGLTKAERQALTDTGIIYQAMYEENDITYQSDLEKIVVTNADVGLVVLNADRIVGGSAQYLLNDSGDSATIASQLINSANNQLLADQTVTLKLDNPALAKLITINGQIGSANIEAKTDANGIVNFDVQVSSDLTAIQREALNQATLKATLTEYISGSTKTVDLLVRASLAEVSLVANTSSPLNLAGGNTRVQVVAQDKDNNVIAGQVVALALSSKAAQQGIVVSSDSTITTNGSGVATFTITAPDDLTQQQKAAIGRSFFVGITTTDSNGNATTETVNINTVEMVQSDLIVATSLQSASTSTNAINAYGDELSVTVQAKQPNGAVATGVNALLNIDDIDGVAIVGGSSKQTDAKGMAAFTITVSPNLTEQQRNALIASGIGYGVTLVDADGATTTEDGIWSVANPASDYTLAISGNSSPLSAYGEVQTLRIVATPKSDAVPTDITGAEVSITLEGNYPSGVQLAQSKVTLDANGAATVDLVVGEGLTPAERTALKNTGINYSVILTEPNTATTAKQGTTGVYIPQAQYKVLFASSSKRQLSSAGDSADIIFRVNDASGGPVVGQEVRAKLPQSIQNLGFITLDTASTQVTNELGLVTYRVSIPNDLTDTQRLELEAINSFKLEASIEEESGVVSNVQSADILVRTDVAQSDIRLSAASNVDSVNVLGDTFTVQVNAVQPNGAAANGEKVQLIIVNTPGVSITGGNVLTTDASGVAKFTVTLRDSLSQADRDALIASGINYLAVLTEADGTQAKASGNVAVTKPESLIEFKSIVADPLSSLGDSGTVVVTLADKDGNAMVDKEVTLALTNTAAQYGITIDQTLQNTDIEGNAIFIVNVPAGLSKAERRALINTGITYQASYQDNNITYESDLKQIAVTEAAIELTLLNADSMVNGNPSYGLNDSGDTAAITAQLINADTNQPLANQLVTLKLNNPESAKLLTINGQIGTANIEATTDANGTVSFIVQVPGSLTEAQQLILLNDNSLQASLTETVTGKTQTANLLIDSSEAEVRLIASAVSALNLSGGSTQVRVIAQDKNDNVIAGQEVTLALSSKAAQQGIKVSSSPTISTDNSGVAIFTITAPDDLTADQKSAISPSFFIGVTTEDSNGNATTETVSVNTAASVQSDLILASTLQSSSNADKVFNAYGDKVTVSVQAKHPNGAVATDVEALLSIENIDGVAIVGGNSKQTDANGMAQFTLTLSPNLSPSKRAALIASGIGYEIRLVDAEGASTIENGSWDVAIPASDYTLAIAGNASPISAYGETQAIRIIASPKSDTVPTDIAGAKVTVQLNGNPAGVSLEPSTVLLDDTGSAVVNLIIDDSLTAAQRSALKDSGISYTATLLEPNKSTTTESATTEVYIPSAQYQIKFDNSSKRQLSITGDTAEVSFRVNDLDGGVIVGQEVRANLETQLTDIGVTLDETATQLTDEQGLVTYTLRIPTGLTTAQRQDLEAIGRIALNANVIEEETGVVSKATSQPILISSAQGASDIRLTAAASVASVNVLGDSFKVRVSAVQKNGAAAVNKNVQLIINDTAGISITGGNVLPTNEDGIAEFTVNLSDSLSAANRDALVNSGINYIAILTETDGSQTQETGNIPVTKPVSVIDFASITSQAISSLGGSGTIVATLTDNNGDAIINKEVNIVLTNKAQQYGITVSPATQTTDVQGKAVFIVNVPDSLSKQDRDALISEGITYQLSYDDNNLTYKSDLKDVTIEAANIALTILNPDQVTGTTPHYILGDSGSLATVEAQLINQDNNSVLANKEVTVTLNNPNLAKLLTVNGQIGSSTVKVSTDDNGIASFDVQVPSNLTAAQRSALSNANLVATLTEAIDGTTQTVAIDVQTSIAQITLSAQALDTLNVNGGETQVRVVAEDKDGNVLAGQEVALALPSSIAKLGLVVSSSPSQTTNDSGVAIFTIAAPSNLTNAQKSSIPVEFAIGVSTKDSNNNSASTTTLVNTVRPSATQESLTLGASKVVDSHGDTFKVFARVVDANGNGIGNRPVTLAVNDPIKTGTTISGSNTVTTRADGIAEFDLVMTPGASVDQILLKNGIAVSASTTSAEGVALTQDYIVAVDNTTIDSYIIMGSAAKTNLNTGGDQTTMTFRVVDEQGGMLAGVPVRLSIDNAQGSGAALTTASIVTTDAAGLVEAGLVLGANSVNARLNHDIVVTAQIVTPTYDANGNAVMEVQAEQVINLNAQGTQIKVAAERTSLRPDQSTNITTTVIDAAGNPISNAKVDLIDADGNLIPNVPSLRTNSAGVAVFTLNENALTFDSNGNLNIAVRASGENDLVSQTSANTITLVQASQAGISFVDVETKYSVDENPVLNIQIRRDTAAEATALVGKAIKVTTSLGTFIDQNTGEVITGGGVITTQPIERAMINGAIITVPVTLSSDAAGVAVLNAEVIGVTNASGDPLTTTVDTRFFAVTPTILLLQAERSVIQPGGSTDLVAIVKDANDTPVEGVTVVFNRDADPSAGRLSAATAVTNAQGRATVTYTANVMSPNRGVVIAADLLHFPAVGQQTTNITVSQDATYLTLAFNRELSAVQEDIYYVKQASVAVMDGSGRPMANKEVSLNSRATHYSQGIACYAERRVIIDGKTKTEEALPLRASDIWHNTEDPDYNYILQNNPGNPGGDFNGNGVLEPLNPVTILNNEGQVADDDYTFITDENGLVNFRLRYPKMYATWVKIDLDATTRVNGSENLQSFNVQLPMAASDFTIDEETHTLFTPFLNDESPFGAGNAACVDSLTISVDSDGTDTSTTPNTVIPGKTVVSGHAIGLQDNVPVTVVASAYVDGSLVTISDKPTTNDFGGLFFNLDFSKIKKGNPPEPANPGAFPVGTGIDLTVGGSSVAYSVKVPPQ